MRSGSGSASARKIARAFASALAREHQAAHAHALVTWSIQAVRRIERGGGALRH